MSFGQDMASVNPIFDLLKLKRRCDDKRQDGTQRRNNQTNKADVARCTWGHDAMMRLDETRWGEMRQGEMTPSDYEIRGTTRRDEMQHNVATRCKKFPLFFKPMKKYTYLTVLSKPSTHNIGNDGTSRPKLVDWALERHGQQKRPWPFRCQQHDGSTARG